MSQLDGQTKTIDGHDYRVRFLDPMAASDMLQDLAKIIAPALGALGGKILTAEDSKKVVNELLDGTSDPTSSSPESFEKAIVSLIDRIDKAKFREMVNQLAQVTEIRQGDAWPQLSSVLTVHFRGKLKSMYQWFGFALKVQFGDFFSGLGAAIDRAARVVGRAP